MLNIKVKLTLGLAALAAATVLAQTTPTNNPPPAPAKPLTQAEQSRAEWNKFLDSSDKWAKSVKNPAPWFSWGADLRLRNEHMNNGLTLSDAGAGHLQNYFRFRERIWSSFMPVTNLTINGRVAAEERYWTRPSNASQYGVRKGFEERYGIIDNAYVKYGNVGGVPLTLSAGRQDMAFGDPDDWWLVLDGTPGDGSWTFFFDSLRATYDAKEIKTKMDVVYIYQNADPDQWMPTLGRSTDNYANGLAPRPYYLTEQIERGVIVYFSNKSIKNAQVDAYFIYKGDAKINTPVIGGLGDNADIYTVGSKITGTPATNWAYSVEGAYQFGYKQDPSVGAAYTLSSTSWRRIDAFAAKGKLTYLFRDKMQNQVSLVGEFLSGDDPSSKNKDEMFDILWGRWPRWTELGTWFYAVETSKKYLQMNNLGRLGLSWNITPKKGLNFNLMYNALLSPESVPTRDATGGTQFSGTGNFRGHYVQEVLKYQFNKNVSAQVKGELLWEGDYYKRRDVMSFLRTELNFVF
jgi:hypothetical protein